MSQTFKFITAQLRFYETITSPSAAITMDNIISNKQNTYCLSPTQFLNYGTQLNTNISNMKTTTEENSKSETYGDQVVIVPDP